MTEVTGKAKPSRKPVSVCSPGSENSYVADIPKTIGLGRCARPGHDLRRRAHQWCFSATRQTSLA